MRTPILLLIALISGCSPDEPSLTENIPSSFMGHIDVTYPSGFDTERDNVIAQIELKSDDEIIISYPYTSAVSSDDTVRFVAELKDIDGDIALYIPDYYDTVFLNGQQRINHFRGSESGINGIISIDTGQYGINFSVDYLYNGVVEHTFDYRGTEN